MITNAEKQLSFSISIMGHPKREQYFRYLRDSIGIADIPITVDKGEGIQANFNAAWKKHNPKKRWHLVLNDDAIICDEFLELTEQAIAAAEANGCESMSLYFGVRTAMQHVGKDGMKKGFLKLGTLHWGLAIMLRTNYIQEMLDSTAKKEGPCDTRMAYWMREKKIQTYYPMPSLVDHRTGDSLVGDPGKQRKAYKFIDDSKN